MCAVPAVVAVGFSLWVVGATAGGGRGPFWQTGVLTLSEAVALRDAGEVARQIEAGVDPNAIYAVRPGVLGTARATPLEAAVWSRRSDMVRLLVRQGSRIDTANWRRLWCAAVETGANDVVEEVRRYRPGAVDDVCDGDPGGP